MPASDLLAALSDPSAYPHDCESIRLVETHISWVFLTGDFAYKLKKPVNFGFLDFSTLSKRHFYCEEECRCNAAFASELYLGVVCITKNSDGEYRIDGDGEVIEYAVKMRQFDDRNQLDRMLERGALEGEMLRQFATNLAEVYRKLPQPKHGVHRGSAAQTLVPVLDNFRVLKASLAVGQHSQTLAHLHQWSVDTHNRLSDAFEDRARSGWIRERHGDLHLSNLVLTACGVVAFDCIEFSEDLRFIDAINDVAFLVMDCAVRNRPDLAYTFFDAYLEATVDYSGAQLLRFYTVYRSLVRAKVAALRLAQSYDETAERKLQQHLDWATENIESGIGRIYLMCGLSGSGKSWLAERLLPHLPAVRLRSDLLRRQLGELSPTEASGSGLDTGLYTPTMSDDVYTNLLALTRQLITGGENVIVDATFLAPESRTPFHTLATQLGGECTVVLCDAAPHLLECRILERERDGSDPSEATVKVLRRQMQKYAPPSSGEPHMRIDTSGDVDIQAVVARLNNSVR